MRHQTKGTLLTILSGILFGMSPLFAMTIYDGGSNAMTLSVHRMVLGAICLGAVQLFFAKGSLAITKQELKKVAVCALGFGLTPILLCTSYTYLDTGLCTTIHYVYPVLVLLGCLLFFRDGLTVKKGICCLLCVCGILCFYNPGGQTQLKGILLALCSGCTYAFYIVFLDKSGLAEMDTFKLGFWLNAVSAVEVTAIALVSGQLTFHLSFQAWGATVLSAGVVLSIGVIAFQKGVQYIGAQNGALLSTLEPLTSVVLGILVFHEEFSLRAVIGVVCILLSVILLSVGSAETADRKTQQS